MKFGIDILVGSDPNKIIEYSKRFEELGFDSVWMADHLIFTRPEAVTPEAWTILTVVGVKTKRVKVGTAVSDPHRYHPAVLAQRLATLTHLIGERVILGLGAGEVMNLDPYGIQWNKPVTRMKEAIEVMKLLWNSDVHNPVSYNGEFFRINNAYLQIKPKGKIPIYIGANSPRTRKLTGQIADGWIPAYIPPELYKEYYKDVKESARKSGRDLEFALLIFTCISDSKDDAIRVLKPFKGLFIWPYELEKLGYSVPEQYKNLSYPMLLPTDKVMMAKLKEYNEIIPDDLIDDFAICGNKNDVEESLERYRKAGVERIIFQDFSPDKEKAFKIFSKVIESFRD